MRARPGTPGGLLLRVTDAAPLTWGNADSAGEYSREVALIRESAVRRHVRQGSGGTRQQVLRLLDSSLKEPPMWRHSCRLTKGACELPDRQVARRRQVGQEDAARQVCAQQLFGAPGL